MTIYDDPLVPYDSSIFYDGGNPIGQIFFTPCDDIVPPIYLVDDPWYPVEQTMDRLFRHYKNQRRGRNIFRMSDGTFVDSQLQGTPPNMIQPPTDPYARYDQVENGQSTDHAIFQQPYVVRTYYGGAANRVTPAEAAALEAAGYTVSN